jgi:hypothetical protein
MTKCILGSSLDVSMGDANNVKNSKDYSYL